MNNDVEQPAPNSDVNSPQESYHGLQPTLNGIGYQQESNNRSELSENYQSGMLTIQILKQILNNNNHESLEDGTFFGSTSSNFLFNLFILVSESIEIIFKRNI